MIEYGPVFSYQMIDGKLTLVDIRKTWDFPEETGKQYVVTKVDIENKTITVEEK
jgi:hypothetical protein